MNAPKDRDQLYQEFDEHMAEVRRKLASLWFKARDQTSDPPAFDRTGALEDIDDAASEISITLNFLEDSFRQVSELARPSEGGAS